MDFETKSNSNSDRLEKERKIKEEFNTLLKENKLTYIDEFIYGFDNEQYSTTTYYFKNNDVDTIFKHILYHKKNKVIINYTTLYVIWYYNEDLALRLKTLMYKIINRRKICDELSV